MIPTGWSRRDGVRQNPKESSSPLGRGLSRVGRCMNGEHPKSPPATIPTGRQEPPGSGSPRAKELEWSGCIADDRLHDSLMEPAHHGHPLPARPRSSGHAQSPGKGKDMLAQGPRSRCKPLLSVQVRIWKPSASVPWPRQRLIAVAALARATKKQLPLWSFASKPSRPFQFR